MRKKSKRVKRKAVLTVEASLIITMTILVVGIVISLWIYKFQVCWYTQAASECLLTGSNKSVLYDMDYVNLTKAKWNSVKEENYLEPQKLNMQIDNLKNTLSIKINGETSLGGYFPLQMIIKQDVRLVKPATYIRQIAGIKEMVKK